MEIEIEIFENENEIWMLYILRMGHMVEAI